MSKRVLLIGTGPLPSSDPEQLGFPQLRTEHFYRLLDSRYEVQLVLLQDESAPVPQGVEAVQPGSAGWLERIRSLREDFGPEVVVSAAPYEPARAAALTIGEEPLFVDVPGDPFVPVGEVGGPILVERHRRPTSSRRRSSTVSHPSWCITVSTSSRSRPAT